MNYMNNNQHYALFIFSLLSYHTSTCFGHINSPSSGGKMYILYVANGTCYTVNLTVSGLGWNVTPFHPGLPTVNLEV
jgi:hypothetical protein